jgi:hypothetical protein
MLSVNKLTNSPAGTRFILPKAVLKVNKRECWPESLRAEYKYYLKRSGNKSILTGQRHKDYCRWLKNPSESFKVIYLKRKLLTPMYAYTP